ncbi:peptidase S8 [bacterium LRH843]|nr:peptidase S8 [bacterium LRH843]
MRNMIKTIVIVGLIGLGLSVLVRAFVDNNEYSIQTKEIPQAVELTAMNKLTAEDLSMTTSMFLKQLSAQMQRWSENDFTDAHLREKFEEELGEHPHFHGFAIIENGKVKDQVGEVTRLNPKKLTHRHMDSEFSEPYTVDGQQYMLMGERIDNKRMVLAEVDLAFVKSFVKDLASVADSNGTFFVSGSNPKVNWKTTKDLPENIHAQTVPELGWQIVVHSKDQKLNELQRFFHENQAVIKFKDPYNADAWIAENNDLVIVDHHSPIIVVESRHESAEELIRRLKRDNKLAIVEPNYIISKQTFLMSTVPEEKKKPNRIKLKTNTIPPAVPNDEFFKPYQWNLTQIEAGKGWNLASGEDVTIAILDTGVDPNHLDLQGKLLRGFNAVDGSDNFADTHGHGTHVAGIAAALTNNTTGIAGVSWKSNILPVKVLNEKGEGSSYEVAKGLYWAVDNGADVINMSLGDYNNSAMLYDAIKYAYDRDVVLISASGNDNVEDPMYPAEYKEVFSVAAVDEARNRAFFSNYGPHVDISAPGEHIPSLFPDNNYVVMSGTSMASPHVAGLAGLIRSLRPDLSNIQVYEVMKSSARDLGTKGFDPYYGYGEIDVAAALELIAK